MHTTCLSSVTPCFTVCMNTAPFQDRLLRGKYQPMISQVDADVLASTLKSFLRSLKEPLVTYTQWESFMKIADMVDEMDVQTAVYSLVPELPQPNRDTLSYIILHLQR